MSKSFKKYKKSVSEDIILKQFQNQEYQQLRVILDKLRQGDTLVARQLLLTYLKSLRKYNSDKNILRHKLFNIFTELADQAIKSEQLEFASHVLNYAELFKEDIVTMNFRAELLKLRNQLEESEQVYRDTIAKFPDNVVARTGYANLLLKLQRFEEARQLLSAQIARLQTRDDWINFHVYAMSFVREGKWDDAVSLLKQGVRDATVNQSYLRNSLAFAQLQQRHWEDALDTLREVEPSPQEQPLVQLLEVEIYAEQALATEDQQQRAEYQHNAEQRLEQVRARPGLTVWLQRAMNQLIESYQLLTGKMITAITPAQREAANDAMFDALLAA